MDAATVTPDRDAEMARLLAAAFAVDPFASWMYPDPVRRARGFELLMLRLITVTRPANRVLTTSDDGACALWIPPGVDPLPFRGQLRMIPELPRMRSRAVRILAALDRLNRAHPVEPHWYLFVVGSDPGRRGAGHGRAVIDPVLAECDEQGLPAYLESSNPDNVGYYERFGFTVSGDPLTRAGSPGLIPMWREPRG